MKVIIAGTRDFDDYKFLCSICNKAFERFDNIEIVSGKARGADRLGEKYANCMGYVVTPFPADWDKHGKSAGYKRNKEMAEYAEALIAFWDGESKGTKHMIDLAVKHRLKTIVVNYKTKDTYTFN